MKLLLHMMASLFSGAAAYGATLKADSLLCESPEQIRFLQEKQILNSSGARTVESARLSAEFYVQSGKAAALMRGLATDEEAIRANSRARSNASTAARTTAANADMDSAARDADAYRAASTSCASSGTADLQAEVVESRPISGTARLKLQFAGAPVELWAPASAIRP